MSGRRRRSWTSARAIARTALRAASATRASPRSRSSSLPQRPRRPPPPDHRRRRAPRAGAAPNARLTKSLWYTTYNRDLLSVDRSGSTPFWWAAYTLDVPAMRLLLKYGADPNLRTVKVPERYEEGGPDPTGPDRSGLPPIP